MRLNVVTVGSSRESSRSLQSNKTDKFIYDK